MSNLLLKKDKRKIIREFILRFFIVFLIFLFVTVSFSVIMLIPSRILTFSREISISKEVEIFEQSLSFKKQDSPIDILNKEKLKISFLKEHEDIYVSNYISEIVDVKPEGVKIDGFFYETDEGEYLVLRGEAENRNILISFIEELEKKDIFSKTDFPVSNLAKGGSVKFSIKIYPL